MGEPRGPPLLTPQEVFSSKTKVRGCKLAASGLDPVHERLLFGPCNGVFFWFVLSQQLKIGRLFWLFLDIEIASNLGLEFPQSSNQWEASNLRGDSTGPTHPCCLPRLQGRPFHQPLFMALMPLVLS